MAPRVFAFASRLWNPKRAGGVRGERSGGGGGGAEGSRGSAAAVAASLASRESLRQRHEGCLVFLVLGLAQSSPACLIIINNKGKKNSVLYLFNSKYSYGSCFTFLSSAM